MSGFVWAVDEDGKPCKCYARPENRGKRNCKHKFHQVKGETTQQLISRSQRKIGGQGISGTAKWSIDTNGLLLFEPIDGEEGTLAEPKIPDVSFSNKPTREWDKYYDTVAKVEAIGKIYFPKNSSWMFDNYSMADIDLSNFDTSKVTNMHCMFYYCNKLTDLDLSGFDTSNVVDMSYMFRGCYDLKNLDVSNFDTSNVINMDSMFSCCCELTSLDVSHFNTCNTTNMDGVFYKCCSLKSLNVSSFDTSKVTNMGYMFSGCSSLTNLGVSNFDTKNVTTMEFMFEGCSSLTNLDLSDFDMSKVDKIKGMFTDCDSLEKLDLSSLKTIEQVDSDRMFERCAPIPNLILSKEVEKKSNELLLTTMLLNCYEGTGLWSFKVHKANLLLDLIEESTGADFSKDRERLKAIQKKDIDGVTDFKARTKPIKEISGIIKVLQARQAVIKDPHLNLEVLKEKGVMSDIDAYLSGVPLEDIFA